MNDVLGNLAVLLAALGVFGTGTGWPDVIMALIMAGLALQGAWLVLGHSCYELRVATSRSIPSKTKARCLPGSMGRELPGDR